MPNNTFDRTAGAHSLAAAGQRERWAAQVNNVRTEEPLGDERGSQT